MPSAGKAFPLPTCSKGSSLDEAAPDSAAVSVGLQDVLFRSFGHHRTRKICSGGQTFGIFLLRSL